jgi:hypothetical protein
MAEDNGGTYLQQILPVFGPFSINKNKFPAPFVLYQDAIVDTSGKGDGSGTVLFSQPDQIGIPSVSEGGGVGTKVQGLKKIRLSLAVFPDKKDIFSPGIYLSIRQVTKRRGPKGAYGHTRG